MNIKITRNELLMGINAVGKAVPSRSTMPILKGILVIAENNEVRLIANNMQLGIEVKLEAEVSCSGKFVIDAKIFSDIVRKIKDEYIEIEVNEKLSVEIKCDNLQMKLMGLSANSFPEMPEVGEENTVYIKEGVLNEMIRQTVFAVSKSEHLQVISGELVEIKKDKIIMASTDSYRFALKKQFCENELKEDTKAIIPGDSLVEIGKLLSNDSNEEVKVVLEDKHALFIIDNIKVVTRLLDGEYLNHDVVIPKEYKTKISINKSNLQEALELAAVFTQNSGTDVRLNITDDKLKISSNADIGNIVKEIDIELEGEDLEIGFNVSYLLEGLKVIDDSEIMICFAGGSSSPAVIIPNKDIGYEYLVVPVRIRSYNSN
ncbi:DNA polymerase III subunit beta [Dethiothermospora halolimnae]|uniref:DNA polymerase III subunit beta n=1 Tax=Dethiothermospora halolimnae TaxID=3114390 RepID=UPI003CCBE19C